jgi:hypothetical protein
MTLKIASETIARIGADGFAQLVQGRIDVLREYDAHEAVVRQHAADPDMKPEDRWVSLAVPQAPHDILDPAIRCTEQADGTHTFEPDYEIVPPAPPSLESRKAKLLDLVSNAEHAALIAVLPQGKVRAFHFRDEDIRKADQVRYKAQEAVPVSNPMPFDIFSRVNRPADDTRFLEEQAAREAKRQAIYRWAANLQSDIEDLTEATIDGWEMKPFNG